MMPGRENWEDDDGRVIADMSGIERPGLFLPRMRPTQGRSASLRPEGGSRGEKGAGGGEQPFTPEERRIYMFAALKAALLIALAFIAGLGAAVGIMLWMWT